MFVYASEHLIDHVMLLRPVSNKDVTQYYETNMLMGKTKNVLYPNNVTILSLKYLKFIHGEQNIFSIEWR